MPTRSRVIDVNAPMVGRTAELERILAVVQDVLEQRHGRLVMLAGEPGVGKTRLAREVLARAQALGVDGFTGHCFEQHTTLPYFPFGDPLAAALGKAPEEIRVDVRARWPELAHILPEPGPAPRASGDETQLQVFRAAAGLLSALTNLRPFVLVLEDLHWADSTSLGLLLYLGRHMRETPILMLGSYRDVEVGRTHPLAPTLGELIRDRLMEEVHVPRLSVAETAELVQSRLPADTVSGELIAVLHERAQGNPFFTEELLAAVVDQGAADPGTQPVSLSGLRVPRSIHLVVDQRVARLPIEAQELLSLASVLGQEFDLSLLLAASDRPPASVLAAVDAAVEARLIEDIGDRYWQRYAFAHALIQQTLYEELGASLRRSLHQRAGDAIVHSRRRDDAVAAELARHFLNSGDTERAAAYAVRAAEEATARYAHAEAAHQYGIAVQILRDLNESVEAAQVRCRLGAELVDLNRLPEALDSYASALVDFEQCGDRDGQASVYWGLGRLHLGRYDMDSAVAHLDRAIRLWPIEREDAALSRLLVDAARAKVFGGDSAGAIDVADRALRLAEQLGETGVIARALVGVVEAHASDMPDRVLVGLMERAEALAREVGDWRTLTRIYLDRAENLVFIGELEKSLADARRAVEAADRSGETERLRFALQALGLRCIALGAWDQGRMAARSGLALDPHGQGVAGNAVLAWLEGRHDEAITHFRTFGSAARERGDVQAIVYGLAMVADCLLQLGRPLEAEAPAREAVEVMRSSWLTMAGVVSILAETLVCVGAQDAEQVLLDAERLIDQTAKDGARPQLLRARGLILMQRGETPRAVEILNRSAEVARSQQARIELARTLAVLTEAAETVGDQALAVRANLERATIVEQIGPELRGLTWAREYISANRAGKRPGSGLVAIPLTPREREVAALVARGMTDRQIADELVITEGTAGVHVSHILNKLGYHTRAEIAKWAVQYLLGQVSKDEAQ